MSNQWHYSQDGAQYGPVNEAEIVRLIQNGELAPGTPVCKEGHFSVEAGCWVGAPGWLPARNHACFQVEIFPKKKVSKQAATSTTSTPASGGTSQLPSQTTAQPAVTPASPLVTTVVVKEKSALPWVLFGVAVLVLVGVLLFPDRQPDEPQPPRVVTVITNAKPKSPPVTQVATNAVAPVDISTMSYIRRTNATTVITNIVRVYFHDKKRFSGNSIKNDKDGTQTLIPMKEGLWHGTLRIIYPSGQQTKYRVNYIQGLRNGAADGWYANGSVRSKSFYTNDFRVGPWITLHPNGKTNKVMVLSTKIPGKVLRRAAFDLTGRPLTGKTPAGRKFQ